MPINISICQLTGLGSYTHCLNPAVAVLRRIRPLLPQFNVTFSRKGTKTLASSDRKTDRPSFLSFGRETQLASVNELSFSHIVRRYGREFTYIDILELFRSIRQ